MKFGTTNFEERKKQRKRSRNWNAKKSKKPRCDTEIVKNQHYLENFMETPGLQHLATNIFLNLNYKDLKACQHVNQSSNSLLQNPRFWIKKFVQKGLSKSNEMDWLKAIQLTKDTDFAKNIFLYLKRSFNLGKISDLPCFVNEYNFRQIMAKNDDDEYNYEEIVYKNKNVIRDDLDFDRDELMTNDEKNNFQDYTACCVQVMAPCFYFSISPSLLMYKAARIGFLKLTKSLIPLAEKPNIGLFYSPQTDKAAWRATPIGVASQNGNLEIIKCLIPFEDNLNAIKLNESIRIAKLFNHQHVVKYLISILNKL